MTDDPLTLDMARRAARRRLGSEAEASLVD
jgi:hypothetical protein